MSKQITLTLTEDEAFDLYRTLVRETGRLQQLITQERDLAGSSNRPLTSSQREASEGRLDDLQETLQRTQRTLNAIKEGLK